MTGLCRVSHCSIRATLSKSYSQVDILDDFPFRRRDICGIQGLGVPILYDGQGQLLVEVMSRRAIKEDI
jgi:hypothetical protein